MLTASSISDHPAPRHQRLSRMLESTPRQVQATAPRGLPPPSPRPCAPSANWNRACSSTHRLRLSGWAHRRSPSWTQVPGPTPAHRPPDHQTSRLSGWRPVTGLRARLRTACSNPETRKRPPRHPLSGRESNEGWLSSALFAALMRRFARKPASTPPGQHSVCRVCRQTANPPMSSMPLLPFSRRLPARCSQKYFAL